MKKGEGLSLTTVVIAALALLVLVILSVILVGRMAEWGQNSRDCVKRGGTCYNVADYAACQDVGTGVTQHSDAICTKAGADGYPEEDTSKICCIRAG